MEGEKYNHIVRRLRDTLRGVTLKLMGMFLGVALLVGGVVGYLLYRYPPHFIMNEKTERGTIWKVALAGALVGFPAAYLAYRSHLI